MGSTEHLKAGLDLRHLVETELGRPHSRGNAWTWRCPFHNEQHGYSLAVWKNGWHCFGACDTGGDVIAWVMQRDNCTFNEAIPKLGGTIYGFQVSSFPKRVDRANTFLKPASEPPPVEWQTAALKIVEQAEATLWSATGERVLAYLRQERGLYKATIRQARLGYLPGHHRAWRKLHGLSVPCGITIPWFADGALWGIKVRRAGGDIRYQQVGGGHIAGGLYWADKVRAGWPALLVEGEFNALIAWQEAMDLICPVSLGSASTPLDPRWYAHLGTVPYILACYDRDTAGEKALERLLTLTARARSIHVPEGKDINAYYLLHWDEPQAIFRWLDSYLQAIVSKPQEVGET